MSCARMFAEDLEQLLVRLTQPDHQPDFVTIDGASAFTWRRSARLLA